MGYRQGKDAARGYKILSGKKYTLWGWLTTFDKRRASDPSQAVGKEIDALRRTNLVRIVQKSPGGIYGVWIRKK